MTSTQLAIVSEIYKVVEKLGGGSDILAPIGSWGEELSDEQVLDSIRQWNEAFASNKPYHSDSA